MKYALIALLLVFLAGWWILNSTFSGLRLGPTPEVLLEQQRAREAVAADLEELGFTVEDALRTNAPESAARVFATDCEVTLLPPPDPVIGSAGPVHASSGRVRTYSSQEGRHAVTESLRSYLAAWRVIYDARFKLKHLRIEFPRWDNATFDECIVAFGWEIRGEIRGGIVRQERARFRGTLRREEGWRIATLEPTRHDLVFAKRRLFTQVTRAGGLETFTPAHLDAVGPFIDTSHDERTATNLDYGGVACADVDGDDDLDLYVAQAQGGNLLFLNRGDGRFREGARSAGVACTPGSRGAVFGDVDGDGDQDLFVTKASFHHPGVRRGANQLFLNDGKGRFRDVTKDSGLAHEGEDFSATFLDYDGDGDLDLYVCAYGHLGTQPYRNYFDARNGFPNRLYRNDGRGRFEEVGVEAGVADEGWSYAIAACDYDADGDLDLYVANDYGPNRLYRNRGDGRFEPAEESAGVRDPGNGMGAAWADVDGDGRFDLYTTNMSSATGRRILGAVPLEKEELREELLKFTAGNSLFLQGDDGQFRSEAGPYGIASTGWAWHADFLDVDRDGRQDLYVTNGYVTGTTRKDY